MSITQNKVNIYISNEKDFPPPKIRRFFNNQKDFPPTENFSRQTQEVFSSKRIFLLNKDCVSPNKEFFNQNDFPLKEVY